MKKLFTLLILFVVLSSFTFATNLENNIVLKEGNTEYKIKGPLNIASNTIDIGSLIENPFIYLYSNNAHFTIGLHQLGGLEHFKINPGYENVAGNSFVMDHRGNINMSENVNIGKNLLVQGTPVQKQIQPTICEYGIKYIDQSGAITCVGEANLNIPENYTYIPIATQTITQNTTPIQTTNYNENGDLVFQAETNKNIIFII